MVEKEKGEIPEAEDEDDVDRGRSRLRVFSRRSEPLALDPGRPGEAVA